MPEEDLLKAMAEYKEMWQQKSYNKKQKRMAKSAGRLSDECTSSKDSGQRASWFKRDFQLIRFMPMRPSVCSIADAARRWFSV